MSGQGALRGLWGLALLGLATCTNLPNKKGPEVLTSRSGLKSLEAQVVERSAPISPRWIKPGERAPGAARMSFVGELRGIQPGGRQAGGDAGCVDSHRQLHLRGSQLLL